MARWAIEDPTTLDFDGAVTFKATLIAGSLSVLAGDRASVRVGSVSGRPVIVTHDAGLLTVAQEVWEGLKGWLRADRPYAEIAVTLPAGCPVHLNLVGADVLVSGMASHTNVRSGAGGVTLDGVTGRVEVTTASGDVDAQGLDGTLTFGSGSGGLSLARARLDRLTARSLTGKVTADLELRPGGQVQVNTVSGEVTLRLPVSTSAEVSIGSTTGHVEAFLPGLDRYDKTLAKGLTGRVGDGSGRLSVTTVSGAVTLLSRSDDAELED